MLDLPVGRGRRFLANAPRAIDEIVGGWSVNGIVTLQSGFPLAFTANQSLTSLPQFGFGTIRPDLVPGCNLQVSGSAAQKVASGEWFNTSCFVQPPDFTLGNVAREEGTVRSQGIANWDIAASKHFPIWKEKLDFEFRAEAFNLFNRVQFAPPATEAAAAGFGSISSQLNQPRVMQFAGRIRF